jgi:tripartite-type tricarboxylate transporter receptor subunit TctC
MRLTTFTVLIVATVTYVKSSQAEEPYPSRLITIVRPLAAGTTGDFLARS